MKFEEMMKGLRVEYLAEFPDKIKKLNEYLEAKDWENLRNEFHKLKGTGKTYGFPKISEIALKGEEQAKSQLTENLAQIIQELAATVATIEDSAVR